MVIAALAAAALGALLAWPLMRLGGVNFALGTLAWAFFLALVPFTIDEIRNGQSGWSIRAPSLDVPGLNWLNDLIVHKLEWTGDVAHMPKMDFTMLQEQILLFLVVFGLLTLVVHAVLRSASGRATLAVRSSEVAAEASGIRVNRSKILIFALSAGIAGIGGAMLGMFSFAFTDTTAPVLPGLIWLALAVTFGIRRPGGALLAGFAFAGGTAVFHWISSWSFLSGGDVQALITSIVLHPDPLGPRRDPARAGARRHPRARGPAEAPQEAGEGAARAHRGSRSGRARRRGPGARAAALDRRGSPPLSSRRLTAAGDGRSRLSDADVADAAFAVRGIVAGYGDAEVLHGVDLQRRTRQDHRAARRERRRQVDALLGGRRHRRPVDGHGLPRRATEITDTEPFRRARAGVLLVPEARGIFPGLTVEENLTVLLRDDTCARTPTTASRSSRNGASRWPACSPAASSRCSASRPRSPILRWC